MNPCADITCTFAEIGHAHMADGAVKTYGPEGLAGKVIRARANALADARVRYAQEFARQKLMNPGMTDKAAMFAATEITNDEVTRLEAEAEIARRTH